MSSWSIYVFVLANVWPTPSKTNTTNITIPTIDTVASIIHRLPSTDPRPATVPPIRAASRAGGAGAKTATTRARSCATRAPARPVRASSRAAACAAPSPRRCGVAPTCFRRVLYMDFENLVFFAFIVTGSYYCKLTKMYCKWLWVMFDICIDFDFLVSIATVCLQ